MSQLQGNIFYESMKSIIFIDKNWAFPSLTLLICKRMKQEKPGDECRFIKTTEERTEANLRVIVYARE